MMRKDLLQSPLFLYYFLLYCFNVLEPWIYKWNNKTIDNNIIQYYGRESNLWIFAYILPPPSSSGAPLHWGTSAGCAALDISSPHVPWCWWESCGIDHAVQCPTLSRNAGWLEILQKNTHPVILVVRKLADLWFHFICLLLTNASQCFVPNIIQFMVDKIDHHIKHPILDGHLKHNRFILTVFWQIQTMCH